MADAGQKSVGFPPAGTIMARGFGPGAAHEMATGVLVTAAMGMAPAFGADCGAQPKRTASNRVIVTGERRCNLRDGGDILFVPLAARTAQRLLMFSGKK